jgi:hypothetical protein
MYDLSKNPTDINLVKINERKNRELNSQTMQSYVQIGTHNSRPPSSSKNKKFISIKVNQKFGV